jgi:hypothetical protein
MQMPIEQDVLVRFLIEAKRRTYAAGGGESEAVVAPLLPGSHQLEHRDGTLLYRDIYFGEAYFVGQETVYAGGAPIWAMGYAGGFTALVNDPNQAQEIGALLQAALRQVPAEHPYRGPGTYRQGEYHYTNATAGDLDRFSGIETITRGDNILYRLRYSGGLLR